MFVKNHIKQGIIPQILKEFLFTRIMIKKSTKHVHSLQYFLLFFNFIYLKIIV